MFRSGPPVLAVLVVLALVTACTSPVAGTSTPGTTAPTNESTSTKPSSSRPREIKLDGKDPCQLLTSAQLTNLKFDRPGRQEDAPSYKAKGCAWTVSGQSTRVLPVTSEGIEAWTSGKRTGQPQEIAPITGFPAISVTVASDEHRCDVIVDTAEGQYLSITFSVSGFKPEEFPKPCDGARQVAEAAMQNLVK
jgi:hypothetical protein